MLVSVLNQWENRFPALTLVVNMPNILSMNCKHIICLDEIGLILLQPMVVPATGSGRAQNDRFMVLDSLFANFSHKCL